GRESQLPVERRDGLYVVGIWELINHRDPFELVALLQKHRGFRRKSTWVTGNVHDSRRHKLRDHRCGLFAASGSWRIQQNKVRFDVGVLQSGLDIPLDE